MSIEFKLPNLGEGIKSADVASISVKVGDTLQPNQNIMELETDKAVVELPCTVGGTIEQIHVKPGQTVETGALLLTLSGVGAPAEKSAAAPAPAAAVPAPVAAPVAPPAPAPAAPVAGGSETIKCPALGEGIKSADVAGVLVKVGETISVGQNLFEVETDKAVVELPSPVAGKIEQILVQAGASISPGTPLLQVAVSGGAAASATPAAAPAAQAAPVASSSAPSAAVPAPTASGIPAPAASGDRKLPAPAGPATRRLARQLGVDLYQVKGTGRNGRITGEDVQAFVHRIMSGAQPLPGGSVAPNRGVTPLSLPDFTQFGTVERKVLNKISKTAANNLSFAWQTIPHVTQHDLADVTELEAGRKRHSQNQKSGGVKITMTVLAIKAIVAALKQYPHFNASYDSDTQEIIFKQYYHVGIAVDTEYGLVVPVIRDVNHKSIVEIARELDSLAVKARERKLAPADFQGGTFTITNLGGIGGTHFSPIVNWPEVAILGMSRARQQLVVVDGEPEVRLMLPLSLSYDHRVINGADAARFIVKVSGLLADPSQLLIES